MNLLQGPLFRALSQIIVACGLIVVAFFAVMTIVSCVVSVLDGRQLPGERAAR